MSTLTRRTTAVTTGWYAAEDCSQADFRDLVEQTTRLADYPHADAVVDNVVAYGPRVADHTDDPPGRRAAPARLADALAAQHGRRRSRVG